MRKFFKILKIFLKNKFVETKYACMLVSRRVATVIGIVLCVIATILIVGISFHLLFPNWPLVRFMDGAFQVISDCGDTINKFPTIANYFQYFLSVGTLSLFVLILGLGAVLYLAEFIKWIFKNWKNAIEEEKLNRKK